jgi:hypothetical protein
MSCDTDEWTDDYLYLFAITLVTIGRSGCFSLVDFLIPCLHANKLLNEDVYSALE